MQLEKATIEEMDGKTAKNPFAVQFNPTTLRMTLNNAVEGGQTHGKQVRQQLGRSSTTLALDLVFDTADEGSSDLPVSVRKKTAKLEGFLVPKTSGRQQNAPPRMRFTWGDLTVTGVVDTLTIDFEHFAANGTPLRAKVSLSIKEQDPDKELKAKDERGGAPPPTEPGANAPGGGNGGGGGAGGPGAPAGRAGASPNAAVALAGESAGEFAARVGVDPAAWRGLQLGGENSLSLSAGAEIGFSANLSASAGLGVTLGVEAGASVSLEASFGLEASAGMNAVAGVGVGSELAAGFALSSAGGVTAAIESVRSAKSQAAEEQARSAFNAPAKALPAQAASTNQAAVSTATAAATIGAPAASAQPRQPEQKHVPLNSTGLPSVSSQTAAQPAPRIPRADPRASSFGFGVPLRGTVGEAADRRAESIRGDVAIKSRVATGDPPTTSDPTTPGWVALPKRDRGRNAADKLQISFRPQHPCGCAGGCKH